MSKPVDNSGVAVPAVFLLAIPVVIVATWMGVRALGCWWSWSDSGMAVRYRPFAGCQVERHGHWFPTSTIRETP